MRDHGIVNMVPREQPEDLAIFGQADYAAVIQAMRAELAKARAV